MKATVWMRHHWRGLLAWTALLALGLIYFWRHRQDLPLNREALLEFGLSLPPSLLVAAFLLLPLVGFPVSPLLLLLGLRFGIAGGMTIAVLGMLFHHVIVHAITQSWMREKMERFLAARGHRIPSIQSQHRLWFTAAFTAIHGPPYTAKLYLLALTDLPFRYYLGIGLPVYVGFSLLPIAAGTAVMEMSAATLSGIVLAALALLFLAHRLKKRFRAPATLENEGEKNPAEPAGT